MNETINDLRLLAARAGRGDAGAAEYLRRALQPQLARIVRRHLREPDGSSPLARRIQSEVNRAQPEQREGLASRVAGDLGQALTGGFASRRARGLCETVLA
jgi:hypothetical protein